MSTVLIPGELTKVKDISGGNGGGVNGHHPDGEGGSGPRRWRTPPRTYRTGMWIGLSAILMLFAAFTSAMVVRKGASNDWDQAQLPAILYWNTAFLIASSITLELARAALRTLARSQSLIESARARGRYRGCLYATLMLGVCFIAGQLLAWNQLTAAGIFLETNPSSSFFYLLTAAHGVHLLGGIVALLYLVFHVRKTLSETPGLLRTAVDVASIYWHFMDGLWVYLLVILTVRW